MYPTAPNMRGLFGQVHDEDPMCDEEYERFREYLREREEERVKQRG